MADTLPQNFPIPSESAIASYSYTDIAEGTGVVVFTGAAVHVDNSFANNEYILTSNSFVSASPSATGGAPRVACSALPVDFEVEFNLPKIIKGNFYAIIPLHVDTGNTADAKVTIQKWDGSSETEIVSVVTSPTFGDVGADVYVDVVIKIPIPTTKFKAGETLRIQIDSTSNSANDYINFDPTGSQANFTRSGGKMEMHVPFKLSL